MMSDLVNIVWNTLDSVFSWMEQIFDRWDLSYTGILLAMFAIMALCRYILKPFVGGGMSDSAEESRRISSASRQATKDSLSKRGYL